MLTYVTDGATAFTFADAATYATWLRQGQDCALYGQFNVALGPGGQESTLGRNTYGVLSTPIGNPPTVTVSSNIVQNYTVPARGSQIAVTGLLKDTQGNPLASYTVEASSRGLTNVANSSLSATVVADTNGAFTLNLLPGLYSVKVHP